MANISNYSSEELYQIWINHKHNFAKAARSIDVPRTSFQSRVNRYQVILDRAIAPRPEFDNPTVERVSAYQRTGDPEEPYKWVKYKKSDQAEQTLLKAYSDSLLAKILPVKSTSAPQQLNTDLLNCFVISDYHLGMYAWHEEAGEDWDIKLAKDLIIKWFDNAIAQAPKAETAIFAQLGDFLHFDGLEAVTPQNRHILDADSRFQLLVRTSLDVVQHIINRLLESHQNVHVVMAMGNHDQASSAWLREALAKLYENEPRLSVERSADAYYAYEFGQTSLFFHHGHKRNLKNIDSVFASKFRDIFGRTKYSYGHLGHLHNTRVEESNLMTVEQHPTLAAKDAYAAHGGWQSLRAARVSTYHKRFGKCGELIITPEMVLM